MPALIWHADALEDVARLYDFLAPSSPSAARRAALVIREAADKIAERPGIGTPRAEFKEWPAKFGRSAYILRYSINQKGAAMIDYHSIITLEPGKRGGKPCIRGLRITVQDVLEWLAFGMEVADIIADYPELVKEDIMACLAYAADGGKHAVWVKAA